MTTPDKAPLPAAPEQPDGAGRRLLRQQLLARRNTLAPALKEHWDQAIGQRLLERYATLQQEAPVALLGAYWPTQGEPDLRPAYATLAASGVSLALPVVVGRSAPLRFARWVPGAALTAGAFGVPIPAELAWVEPAALLVPCLGFTSQRIRLGYGGGFYDRTLSVVPRPAAIGIAYDCLHAEFAAAPHDIALDCIITESACW